jgi:hypothetical protein
LWRFDFKVGQTYAVSTILRTGSSESLHFMSSGFPSNMLMPEVFIERLDIKKYIDLHQQYVEVWGIFS